MTDKSLQRKAVRLVTILMLILGFLSGAAVYLAVDAGQSSKIAMEMNEKVIRESAVIDKHMIEAETAVKSIYALANQLVDNAADMQDEKKRQAVKESVGEVFAGIANDSDSVLSYYMTFDPDLIHDRDGIFFAKDLEGTLHEQEITDIASYAEDDVEHIGWYTIPKNAGRPVWMDPYYNKNINRWLISYIIPFFKDGQMVAVIGIDFEFKDIVEEINEIRFLKNGYCFLKNADGTIHYHPEFFEGESHGDEMSQIPEKSRALFDSGETRNKTVIYTFADKKRVGVMTTLENGMVLHLVDSYSEVYMTRNLQLLAVILLTMLITVAAIAIVHRGARKLTGPMQQLTDAVALMENGQYDVELPEGRDDEIGILIQGTKLLAETLKKQKAFNETTIAERNRMLEEAIVTAEDANRAKTAFLSNMSHDIRTPMNAILGLSEMAKKHTDEQDKVVFYLDQIGVAGKQLLSLINNVLEISRIESGKVDMQEEITDTDEVYESLLTIFNNQAKSKNLSLIFNNDFQCRWLYMDRTHMEEIAVNLVSNAMKYTPDGGQINIHFETLPTDDEEYVIGRMTVKDNGIGMSEAFQKKLFQSFEREKDTEVEKIQGSGLGLTIVKNLLDLMGGTITVNSVKDLGTSIVVDVPHRIAYVPALDAEEEPEEERREYCGKRVLLAEDNDVNAMIVEELMTDHGFVVDRAHDGQECLQMLERAKDTDYELILMDIRMPVMDGYEAAKAIRRMEDPVKAQLPIVAMTANAFSEDKAAAMEAGMNAHISKPLESRSTMAVLNHILAQKEQSSVDSSAT